MSNDDAARTVRKRPGEHTAKQWLRGMEFWLSNHRSPSPDEAAGKGEDDVQDWEVFFSSQSTSSSSAPSNDVGDAAAHAKRARTIRDHVFSASPSPHEAAAHAKRAQAIRDHVFSTSPPPSAGASHARRARAIMDHVFSGSPPPPPEAAHAEKIATLKKMLTESALRDGSSSSSSGSDDELSDAFSIGSRASVALSNRTEAWAPDVEEQYRTDEVERSRGTRVGEEDRVTIARTQQFIFPFSTVAGAVQC